MSWPRPSLLRRKEIPMRVLNLGLSRTGTTCENQKLDILSRLIKAAMCLALEALGLQQCYHLDYDSDDCAFWLAAMEAKFDGKGAPFEKPEWDHIFSTYDAISDIPAILFAEELIEAYPEAKILLTTRDVEAWHKSMSQTVCNPIYRQPYHRFPALFIAKEQALCDMSDKCEEIAWRSNFEKFGREFYEQHNAAVRTLVAVRKKKSRAECFLEWELGEGWDRLASFLGADVPYIDFPHGNTPREFIEEADAHAWAMWLVVAKKLGGWAVAASVPACALTAAMVWNNQISG